MARFNQLADQYFDNSGKPLINGKIKFEVSGGGADKSTFADINLTIPNTNPVILSASGVPPSIFFNGAARATLYTSDGVQLRVLDPVPGVGVVGDSFEPWNNLVEYSLNDIVKASNEKFYKSVINNNIGNVPSSTTGKWAETRFIDVWNRAYAYQTGQIVIGSDSNQYESLTNNNTGNNPVGDVVNWKNITKIAALIPANGNVIIGAGATFVTKSGADFRTEIGLGAEDSPEFNGLKNLLVGSDVLAPHENLICKHTNNTSVGIAAAAVLLKDSNGNAHRAGSVKLTAKITSSGVNGLDTGTEAPSTWYSLYVILNLAAISTGKTDSATANKLEDNTADFVTDGVKVGDIVKNTTDGTTTHITTVDDLNTLSVANDIFVAGENYKIYACASLLSTSATSPTMPSGYTYKGYAGAVYNDSGSNFDNFHQVGNRVSSTSGLALSEGSATSYTSIDLSTLIPSTAKCVRGSLGVDNPGSDSKGLLASTITGLGELERRHAVANGNNDIAPFYLPVVESQTIYYKVAAPSDDCRVDISGWEY